MSTPSVSAINIPWADRTSHVDQTRGRLLPRVTFNNAIDTSKLFEVAVAHGVALIPGRAFSVSGSFGNALRLCCASQTPERIEVGHARLATVLKGL
jgi:2-aminoadipate transaminase